MTSTASEAALNLTNYIRDTAEHFIPRRLHQEKKGACAWLTEDYASQHAGSRGQKTN